jgi:holo-[acyl-carrier protein] synthase
VSVIRTGVDLIEVGRVRGAIEKHGDQFLNRIYTENELKDCADQIPSLAARFAAKEATAKALGTGIGTVSWKEIEVRRGEKREPYLVLYGEAKKLADELRLHEWSISLSHTHEHAIAFVVAK